MINIIDTIELKQIEKQLGYRLTHAELETARFDKGHVTVVVKGNSYHLKLTLLSFPNDLIKNEELDFTPWGQVNG